MPKVHHGCGVRHKTHSGYGKCEKRHMHGAGFSDLWEGAKKIYDKAKQGYDYLSEKKFASRILDFPVIGDVISEVPVLGQALRLAKSAGLGKKKKKK